MKKRPGRLWLLFYGRQRRGVPYLLIGIAATILALALLFTAPGVDYARAVIFLFFVGILSVAIVAAFLVAAFFPRRRR